MDCAKIPEALENCLHLLPQNVCICLLAYMQVYNVCTFRGWKRGLNHVELELEMVMFQDKTWIVGMVANELAFAPSHQLLSLLLLGLAFDNFIQVL